jgi:conjugative relaxase-like TrwC/TraI family protein
MNSAQASKYHEQDQNYYQDQEESLELSSWQGQGAKDLGLNGTVDNKVFSRLCQGIHPVNDQVLVDTTKRAGTDLTFSAPKSLSVLAELSDKDTDLKIREAHSKAVKKTMQFAEQYAQTREQIAGERKIINTNNLVIAKFNHDTSRENDPQLHTHCFVLNMTQKQDGTWRALHNDQLFKNKMLFGQIYRNELAKNIKELGYDIEITNAKQGLWELKDFNKDLLKEFSTRREQVEKKFRELKAKFPNLGDAKLKEMATLDSRKSKNKNINRKELKKENIKRAEQIVGKELNPFEKSVTHLSQNSKINLKVEEVLKIAQEILTSKESLFSKEQLIQESLKLSINSYTLEDIEEAIKQDKELINLESNIYTTKEMINIEQEIVENIKNAKELKPITNLESAKEFIDNHYTTFTQGQKEAFLHIATSTDGVIAIQGDAGAGKTYMLKALKEFSSRDNLQGLAFTGKAAEEIEEESGIKSNTLHSFLNQKEFKNNQIYIIDEASMVGSKQFYQLQSIANKTNSKIILIGDTKQFQTIQAGGIFLELQKRDLIKTAYMTENLRAKTELLKEIYKNIKEKNIKEAFKNIEANNLIKETSKLEEIKEEYLKDKDNTLLIASKNRDRRELNEIIRDELKKQIKNEKEFIIRENTALDDIERHYAQNYKKDQIVFINKAVPGLKAGDECIIKEVDTLSNTIILKKENKEIVLNLSKFGGNLSSFNELRREFGVGDKIVFTKNDRKLKIKNGQIATIIKLEGNTLHYQKESGNKGVIDLNNYNYIDWGYAITDYKSQGQTSKNVIVVADSKMAKMNSFYVQVTRAKESLKIYTDNISTLKERAEREQVKTSTLDYYFKSPKTKEEKAIKNNFKDNVKITNLQKYTKREKIQTITENEYNNLKNRTKSELKLADPAPVLDALGIEYKQSGNRYIFKARADERTASANMYLDKNGEWKYKDFGSGQGGGIENLIMDVTGMNYKEALAYAIANTNITDYLQEKIDELRNQKTQMTKKLPKEIKDELKKRREANKQRAREQQINSKVVSVTELSQKAKEYLATRGIYKIPPEFKQITGEYKSKNGEIKKSFGVGILTKNSTGADIHFLKKIGNLKTMSFGEKDISFFQKPNSKDVAVFESKMDYAAAYQQIDFFKTDVIIANSTSNAFKVADEIKNRYETVHFFNQNDEPGKKFVREIIDNAKVKNYSFIKYQKEEVKQDINDLIKSKVDLQKRRKLVVQKESSNNQINQQGENHHVYNRRGSKSISLLADNSRQFGVKHKSLKSNLRAFIERTERIIKKWREELKRDIRGHRKEIRELGKKSNIAEELESSILKDLKTVQQNQNKDIEITRSR